jgi:TolB-like protein/Tfp pilus assembly protein PilF
VTEVRDSEETHAATQQAAVSVAAHSMNVWARIKEHKVAQWTLAYAAAAYAVLHGTEMVSNAFEWPHLVVRIVTLLLFLGVPLVATLAWYHGHRGQQRVSGTELTIIAVLLVIAGTALWHFARPGEEQAEPKAGTTTQTAVTGLPSATPRPNERSIAVLPFENRSREVDDAFFVDGIHDDILTQLTKIGAMKVIARTSVEQFRGTKLTAKEVGEKLGVTRVLEGSVQRAGKRVHVTVQLIEAATDAHLWAESYDRELTVANIFAIQSEVAAAIATALKTTLTPAERLSVNAIPTQNLDAWEAYQLGKQRMANPTSTGLAEAETFFQRAINLDPKFALAYVGLADTLSLQVDYSGVPRGVGYARAEQAVGTALELDPDLAEAVASSASIAAARGQYDRAEPMFRRAITLNPNYATAHHWYAWMLLDMGRLDEAISFAARAAELDPLSPICNSDLGRLLAAAGRFDEAETRYRKVIEIEPSMPDSYEAIGRLRAFAFNRYVDAVQFVEKAVELDPGSPSLQALLARLYLDLGDDARATRIIQAAHSLWPDDASVLRQSAVSHLYRGEPEAARQDAGRSLKLDPLATNALIWLNDADVRKGDYAAARARVVKSYPELFAERPKIHSGNYDVAISLVPALQKTGERSRASILLDRIEEVIRTIPRMGYLGYWITDVQIYALRGQKAKALAALRAAEKAGWRIAWRYYREFDSSLASIRDEPEFKAIFADIERDMARQRTELAARPKNAPLDLNTASK